MEGLLNASETGKKIQTAEKPNSLIAIVEPRTQSSTSPENPGHFSISKPTIYPNTGKRQNNVDCLPFLQQTYLVDSGFTSLPGDAKVLLKSQPSHDVLVAILNYLQSGVEKRHGFDVRAQGATASAITDALVTVIIPSLWGHLQNGRLSREDVELKRNLLSCITSYSGLSRLMIQIKQASLNPKRSPQTVALIMLSVLENILKGTRVISDLLAYTLITSENPMKRLPYWQELASLLAGSKVLSGVAEYESKYHETGVQTSSNTWNWLGNGSEYCKWLAKNITSAAIELKTGDTEAWGMLGKLTQRAFSLGSRDSFIIAIYSPLMSGAEPGSTTLHELLRNLLPAHQKIFFDNVLKFVTRKYLNSSDLFGVSQDWVSESAIAAIAAMIKSFINENDLLKSYAGQSLTDTNNANFMIGLSTRRAVVATFSLHEDPVYETLEKCLKLFSDTISIQYMSISQQEVLTQNLLLLFGYLNRLNPDRVKNISRSSSYLPAISNRLGASLPRARYLGMILGVAVSKLVDKPKDVMKFDVEEMRTEETKEWIRLINVFDEAASINALKIFLNRPQLKQISPEGGENPMSKPLRYAKKATPTKVSKIISIEEIEDSGSEDDDLVPYQKPDEDASDSEEDPTLIDRSKPRAPVYIIDLIKFLKAINEPETVQLALETAPSLIQRKTGFGAELSDNIDKLLVALLNLNDGMSKEAAQNLRLEALIACVVALPTKVAPYLSRTYFEDDHTLVQRASLLSAIGLASRELAGHALQLQSTHPREEFPSKRLPQHLSNIYGAVDSVVENLSHGTLKPMALAAADNLTGPNILKVRTFSSRLDVEKKSKEKSKARSVRIPKDLHKVLADSFYLPLCRRMNALLSIYFQSNRSTVFEPHIFRLFLQTLAVILNTLGPHAAQLSALTGETLQLLTNIHNKAKLSLDPAILPPLLQMLLNMLDLNVEGGSIAEERLVTDFGISISELIAWVAMLQDSQVPIDEKSGIPWTVLAAGCQVKWQEVGRKFQGRMMGLTGTEMDSF